MTVESQTQATPSAARRAFGIAIVMLVVAAAGYFFWRQRDRGVQPSPAPREGAALLDPSKPDLQYNVLAVPVVSPGGFQGVEADRWMGRRLLIELLAAPAERVSGHVLRVEFESLAPAATFPMRVAFRGVDGPEWAATSLVGGGHYALDLPLERVVKADAPVRVEVVSDRVFVPREINPQSQDARELSVRLLRLGVARSRAAEAKPGDVWFEGLTEDGWLSQEARVAFKRLDGSKELVVDFESHAPAQVGPIEVTLHAPDGKPLATHQAKEPGPFSLAIALDATSQAYPHFRLTASRSFVPASVLNGSTDQRQLSVLIVGGKLR